MAWEECAAQGGFIVRDKQRLSFGELAEEAAQLSPPSTPVLRPEPARERAIDHPEGGQLRFPRLDLPSKVDGSMQFAGDVRLPGMVYAAIRNAPLADGDLAGFDAGTAKGIRGLIKLVPGKRWLAAVATDWWAAERALSHIAPRFSATNRTESARIDGLLEAALRTGAAQEVATRWRSRRDVCRAEVRSRRALPRGSGAACHAGNGQRDGALARRQAGAVGGEPDARTGAAQCGGGDRAGSARCHAVPDACRRQF